MNLVLKPFNYTKVPQNVVEKWNKMTSLCWDKNFKKSLHRGIFKGFLETADYEKAWISKFLH